VAAGLTQESLAEASGLSVRALRDLERGHAQAAQRRSTEALADALRLTGSERAVFLASAHEGRRRTIRSPTTNALCALPPQVPDLLGREAELARLRAEAATGGTVVVVGHPGVGKTTLAVSTAHRLREEFPDGCFAVDLRGMDDQPVSARTALDRLLRALGVPSRDIPATEAEQSNLFRLVLTDRRVLVLLDNAATEEQVRPLLATVPGCLTLVTCRHTLAGLTSARWVLLDPLADQDAVGLLAAIVGRDRVAEDPRAAAELVSLCGNLPLAVRIVGNRLATRPNWSLAYLATQLRDERTRLTALAAGDLQVRSAFDVSYRRLSPAARQVFRRLATLPGADFDAELAEVATGVPTDLDELVDVNLLQATPVPGRFQFHDLIRLFAAERFVAEETGQDEVVHAVLDHLLATATEAARLFYPDAVDTGGFTRDEAARWLDREQSNWIAAHREAARLGRHQDVLDLAKAMHWYSDGRWMQDPWAEIFALGVAAAQALDNRPDESKLLNFLGWAEALCLGDYKSAYAHHEQALAIAVDIDDRQEQAWAHAYMSAVLMNEGNPEPALTSIQQACDVAFDLGYWTMRVSLRNRLGRSLQALSRYEEALSVHENLLVDCDKHQDETSTETYRWITAVVRSEVGHCLGGLGKWRAAAETYAHARVAFAESNMRPREADTALQEGIAWRKAGDNARARERLTQALDLFAGTVAKDQQEQVLAELALLP
jgi:tetratricopeptide (TPR) repeat protein/transcriptional regulator with XRE-family HTH domain